MLLRVALFLMGVVASVTVASAGAHEARAQLGDAAHEVVTALKAGDVNTLAARVGPEGLAIGSSRAMGDTGKPWSRDELLAAWRSDKRRTWSYCGGCGGAPEENPRLSVRRYFATVVYSRDFLSVRPKVFPPNRDMPHVKERARGVWTVSYVHAPNSDRWRELDLHFVYRDNRWWLVEIQNREWEI